MGRFGDVTFSENLVGDMVMDTRDVTKVGATAWQQRLPIEEKSADFTLTKFDTGKTFVITAVDKKVTLPPTVQGVTFRFVVSTISATTGFQISPDANDKIIGGGLTPADDKDCINTAATDAVGDLIEIIGDVAGLGWLIIAKTGTWARET